MKRQKEVLQLLIKNTQINRVQKKKNKIWTLRVEKPNFKTGTN